METADEKYPPPPEYHVICIAPPQVSASKVQLVSHGHADTPVPRSASYWCSRFIVLVCLVTLLQLAVIVLVPTIHRLVDNSASPSRLSQDRPTELSDVFLAVKSTKRFHATRLSLLLDTWIDQAKEQTYVFTDGEDESVRSRLESSAKSDASHFVVTDCAPGHFRDALACKMAREFDGFYAAPAAHRWFCHFDDDTYVNTAKLVELLAAFDHTGHWYLGRPSIDRPLRLPARKGRPAAEFRFATGGAGFCVSAALMRRLAPLVVDGQFEKTSAAIGLPDDCTVGYVIEALAGVPLTRISSMHSHLEFLRPAVTDLTLGQQVTFSYSKVTDQQNDSTTATYDNVASISRHPAFGSDPTRFLSAHCYLFPRSPVCQPA